MKRKSVLSLCLASAMVISCLAGCGKSNTGTEVAGESAPAAEGQEAQEAAASPVEFEYFGQIYTPYIEDSYIFPAWQEATNSNITFTWNQTDSAATQLATRIANKDLPEVVFTTQIGDLVSQGLLMPITDLLEECMPNFMSKLSEDDMQYLVRADDGEIYGIGLVMDIPAAYSTFVREDWLEALNMETPTNWEEWMNYWEQVKANDMNGDGDTTDEVPLAIYYNFFYMLESMFGINSNGYFSVVDGKYVYDPENPKYEEFLDTMRELYADGILDKEFLTRDAGAIDELGNGNKLGTSVYWAEMAKNYSLACRELGDEDALYQCITPVTGPEGDAAILSRTKMQPNTFFTIECGDKLPEILKTFDYLYSDEGVTLTNFGIEGTHFDYVDGAPVVKAPYNESFLTARSSGLIQSTIPFCFTKDAYMQFLLGGATVDSLEAPGKSFVDGLTINDDYYYAAAPQFSTDEWVEYNELVTEQIALRDNYIMGNISKDEYQSSYETLKANGLQQVIDAAQAAYETVTK